MKNLLGLITFIFISILSFSQTYYVSPSGNNSNSGLSTSQPFATIQKGVDMAVDSGAVVNIMQGTYFEHVTFPNNSATTTNPIIIQNYLNDTVTIDGNGTASSFGSSLFLIQDRSNLLIKGLKFENAFNSYVSGLLIRGHCENITIRNCEIQDISFSNNFNDTVSSLNNSSSPLLVYADSLSTTRNIEIDNVKIKHCNTGWSEALTFSGNVDGFSIHDCRLSDIRNIGVAIAGHWHACADSLLDQARNGTVKRCVVNNCKNPNPNHPASGIYIDGGRNVVIENDTVFDCQNGITVGCENVGKTASNDTVRNNVSYNNVRAGVQIGGYNYPTQSGKVVSCVVTGNTIARNNRDSLWAGEYWITYCDSLLFQNNILFKVNTYGIPIMCQYDLNNGSGNKIDYNLYFNFGSYYFMFNGVNYYNLTSLNASTGFDANSHFLNPQFVDTATDFHLQASSPAINAGNPLYSSTSLEYDIDGQNRMVGIIDCGADETNYPSSIVNINDTDMVVYPNPFKNIIYFTSPISNCTVSIRNFVGSTYYSQYFDSEVSNLDLSSLPFGVYLLTIADKNGVTTNKIIKH
ncbi:MAG: right-handed parallel beta-helix repeat-containing protein [Chitinophagaceae bacterium]|nr:right-handed parallel beta-helix repeat-containing protein [Chitinophagaceae bacterium]